MQKDCQQATPTRVCWHACYAKGGFMRPKAPWLESKEAASSWKKSARLKGGRGVGLTPRSMYALKALLILTKLSESLRTGEGW